MNKQKIKVFLNANLEFLLLLAVWIFIFSWFSHTFKNPIEQPNTTFQYTYWLGEDVQSPKQSWAKDILCKQSPTDLSEDALTWCQNTYPQTGIIEWVKTQFHLKNTVPIYNSASITIEQDQQYQYVQTKFKAIFDYRGSAAPPSSADDTPDQIPSDMVENLQKKYALNAQDGSLALKCSWWLLNSIEQQSNNSQTPQFKNDIFLARSDLLNHPEKAAFFNSSNLWSNNWQSLVPQGNEKLSQVCEKNVGSVTESYSKAAKATNALYLHGMNYTRTIQMLNLSHNMHYIFILYTAITYIILLILRQRIVLVAKLAAFYLGWIFAYYATQKLLGYNVIDNVAYVFTIVSIGLFSLLSLTPKQHYYIGYRLVSPFIFPFLVFFSGVSLLLILDWSLLSNYDKLRFLALRQVSYLFFGLMLISVSPLLRQGAFEAIATLVDFIKSVILSLLKRLSSTLQKSEASTQKSFLTAIKPIILLIILIGIFGFLFINKGALANLTSETTRLFFIFVFASFVSLLPEARQRGSVSAFIVFSGIVLSIVIYLGVSVGDFGPLMIVGYTVIILAMAKIAVTLSAHRFAQPIKIKLSILLVLLIGTIFFLKISNNIFVNISQMGNERTKERVVSMQVPFESTSDQMAITRYFAASVPDNGYGIGGIPWQGDKRGMPEQTQSDYIPVALYGALGKTKFMLFTSLYFAWLAIVVLSYRRLTQGFNKSLSSIEMSNSFFGWVALIWSTTVMVQVCVTVMGNLGVAPLTGVSWPFLSYGQVSLVINCLVLGLLLNSPVEKNVGE